MSKTSSRTWLPSFAWLGLAGYTAGLFVVTHLPSELLTVTADFSDKSIHFFAYAGLALLLVTTWHVAGRGIRLGRLVFAGALILLFAAFDEWTQLPVGRDASVHDWLADAAGAAAGLAVFYAWFRVWHRGGPLRSGRPRSKSAWHGNSARD